MRSGFFVLSIAADWNDLLIIHVGGDCRSQSHKLQPFSMPFILRPPSSPFEPPSVQYRLISSPLRFLTQSLYRLVLFLRGPATSKPPIPFQIRIICIADTHTHKPTALPDGDVLVHAGDLTNDGTFADIQDQIDWISSLPYEHKIVIAGNHDSWLDPRARRKTDVGKALRWGDVHYLQHSSVQLSFPSQAHRRLSFYGAPQIPQCGGEDFAFQYRRSDDAWSYTIPPIDVLITHTPPRHHLDLPAGLGCDYLLKEVWRVRPKVHIFGHVHAGHGREQVFWDNTQNLYEKLCSREAKGVMKDMVAIVAWLDIMRLAVYGVLGILWSRVWGGDEGGTVMINAALMSSSSGRLENPATVVTI